MTVKKVSVSTTPTKILDYFRGRKSYVIYNSDATYHIYLAYSKDSDVWFPIRPNTYISFSKQLGDDTESELWSKAETGVIDIYIFIGER